MVEKVTGEVVGVGNKNVPAETLNSVVNGSVTLKKTTGLKKLWRGFFAEDLKTVKGNVMETVVKPSIKAAIANAVTSAVYTWLFGKNGYNAPSGGIWRPLLGGGQVSGTAYSNLYRIQNGPVVGSQQQVTGPKVSIGENNFGKYTSTDVYDPEYIRYASYADAMAVFENLRERIGKYGVATVKNLMDLSGMTGYEMVLQNWGWYDLGWNKVLPAGDGTWILKLPQPTPLNGPVKSF